MPHPSASAFPPLSPPIQHVEVDSAQGRWRSSWWAPATAGPLADAVSLIWYFEGHVAQPRERVFPGGTAELILQLDGRYHDVINGRLHRTPQACITGLHSAALLVEAPATPVCVLGLRLKPLAMHALLGLPLVEATNLTVDLRDVLPDAADALFERCLYAADGGSRIRIALDWIARGLRRAATVDPALRWMLGQLVTTQGRAAIEPLRERAGFSRSSLQAAFRRHVGLTPKHYARVLRFHHALEQLRSAVTMPQELALVELALRAGYYDQSHMNAEFRAFSGLTPGEFLAAQHYPHTTSLAEERD